MIRTLALVVFACASISTASAEEAKAKPSLAAAKVTAETLCAACHQADGNSTVGANPILAGQGSDYLLKQLNDFKPTEGKPALRNNAIMTGMTAALSAEELQGLALHFSRQTPKQTIAVGNKQQSYGQVLWRKGDFERGIPACTGCHGATGAGLPPLYPRLAGQHAEYTESQLKNYRSEERSNDWAKTMRNIADKLSDKMIKALADYIAGLHRFS